MSKIYIRTYTGVEFDLLNPTPDMVRLEDIAWSIAKLQRFTGHCRGYNNGQDYSVAEHSVLGAQTLSLPENQELAFQYLMHDAHEAYTNDVSSPAKEAMRKLSRELGVPCVWDMFERRIECVVRERFGLPHDLDPRVKEIDRRMGTTEKWYLSYPVGREDSAERFTLTTPRCWTPREARVHFLSAFKDLAP